MFTFGLRQTLGTLRPQPKHATHSIRCPEQNMLPQRAAPFTIGANAMSDIDVMNQGLAGEHFGIAAYGAALGSGLLDEQVAGVARAFQSDHEHHRDLLAEQITKRGGTPVTALDAADYAKQYPPLNTVEDVLAYAIELEAGAARGSVFSVAEYDDRQLALLAARIGAVEAQHWAVLLGATGSNPVPAPLIEPAPR
jgi:hypothetical protein